MKILPRAYLRSPKRYIIGTLVVQNCWQYKYSTHILQKLYHHHRLSPQHFCLPPQLDLSARHPSTHTPDGLPGRTARRPQAKKRRVGQKMAKSAHNPKTAIAELYSLSTLVQREVQVVSVNIELVRDLVVLVPPWRSTVPFPSCRSTQKPFNKPMKRSTGPNFRETATALPKAFPWMSIN